MNQSEISARNEETINGDPLVAVTVSDGQIWWRIEYAVPGWRSRLKAHYAAAAHIPSWLSWAVPIHERTAVPWVSRKLWRSALCALIVSKNPAAVQRLGYRVVPAETP